MRHPFNKFLFLIAFSVVPAFGETEAEGTSADAILQAATPVAVEEESSTSWSIGATSHLLGTQNKPDTAPNAKAVQNYLHQAKLTGEYGPVTGDFSFSSRFTPDGNRASNEAFLIEKKSLNYQDEIWNVKLGDSHVELGRGLFFSLVRDPVFGMDNTLEGANLGVKSGGIDILAFGGRVNVWKAPISINPVDQKMGGKEIYLAGGSLGVEVLQGTKLAGQYLVLSHQNIASKEFTDQEQVAGGTLSSQLSDEVEFYGESNVYFHEGQVTNEPNGYGSYSSLTWSPAPWKLKLEGKDYRKFDTIAPFRRPPLLDEDIVTSINNKDITAGKLLAERKFEGATVYSSFLSGYDREDKSQLYHPVVGSRFTLFEGVDMELKTGYRILHQSGNLAHAQLKTKVKTGKGQFVELEYRKLILNEGYRNPVSDRQDRNQAILGYTFNERWNMAVGYEYIPTNVAEVGHHFANVGGSYRDGPFTGKAFVGKTSGGTLCSGGVCQQVPPYTGAYLETVYTF